MSVYYIYVCADCVKTVHFKVSTRKTGDNLDKFNARLLDLKKPLQIYLLYVMMDGVRFQ